MDKKLGMDLILACIAVLFILYYLMINEISARLIKLEGMKPLCQEDYTLTSFLIEHPFVCGAIKALYADLRAEFGADVGTEIVLSHETIVSDKHVSIIVRPSKYDEKTMDKIVLIRSKYFDILGDESKYLHVTTDFRCPQTL